MAAKRRETRQQLRMLRVCPKRAAILVLRVLGMTLLVLPQKGIQMHRDSWSWRGTAHRRFLLKVSRISDSRKDRSSEFVDMNAGVACFERS